MAPVPVYADHPFPLIPDKRRELKDGEKHDMFQEAAGMMGTVHNCFIRGINAVYLQAPHVKEADVTAFCNFAYMFYDVISFHHLEEEQVLFPQIEEFAGEPGIMSRNVEQHHAFHDGVEAYGKYTLDCARGTAKYDGAHLVGIIDSFGAALTEHLTDEITTLLDLSRFGEDKFSRYVEIHEETAKKVMKQLGLTTGIVYFAVCCDVAFEGGRWSDFPPAPWLIDFAVRNIAYFVHPSWWKFAPSDRMSRLKPLYAVPEN